MIKIYLAAPFFDEEQRKLVKELEEHLELCKFKVYSPSRDGGILKPDASEIERVNVLSQNIGAIRWCDCVVAVIDGRDTGTIWEMGYAYGIGKNVVAFTNKNYGLNVMIANTVIGLAKSKFDLGNAIHGLAPGYEGDIQ